MTLNKAYGGDGIDIPHIEHLLGRKLPIPGVEWSDSVGQLGHLSSQALYVEYGR